MQKTSIRNIELASEGGRVETGVVKFGDDWPGLFIRGDNAFYFASMLKSHLKQFPSTSRVLQGELEGLADLLDSTNVRNHGLVVESADTADLKPADESHEGSSPSLPTNLTPQQEWLTYTPACEATIASGQKRYCFIDGIGSFEAEIMYWTRNNVTVKAPGIFKGEGLGQLDWDVVGITVGGLEDQRLAAELEQEAVNAQSED